MKKRFAISALLLVILLIPLVISLTPEREQKLKFGPALYIKEVGTEPAEMTPGSTAELKIVLENIEDFLVKDVKIKIDLPAQFAPMEVTEKKIRRINGKEIVEVNFSIITLPDAKAGVYKVPLQLEYIDEIGQTYKENNTISLIVSSVPQIFVRIESSEIYEGNKIGEVVINIVNNGVADIKFLTAELEESEDYDILTSNKVYVGELDSDDYESIEFRLKVLDGKSRISLPLMLEYSDANNRKYDETLDVTLNIRGAKEAGIQENKTGLTISIILGLIIVYIVYRGLKKRASRKHLTK